VTATTIVCIVCTETVVSDHEAWCNACGKPYHLNQRSDVPGKDCGMVWINEEHLALEFACNTCLEPAPAAGLDDVLDLAEAAEAAGVTPEWLAAEAAARRVAHRRTGSGVLLFVRGDIATLAGGNG
jgi:hypothetical protein